jgi:hypothetical protein
MHLIHLGFLVFLLLSPFSVLWAAENIQKDVLFVVLGKTANYRQSTHGSHKLLNYHFFAEIFLKEKGRVRKPALIMPGGASTLVFKGDDSVLEVHGGRYESEIELNDAFPDGTYIFSYRLSDSTLLNQSVMIKNGSRNSRIPEPVNIYLLQNKKKVKSKQVDPNIDLTVRWSEFKFGNEDPNKIVDDLVFVVTGNCHGKKIDHSGGPFGNSPYLTFASEEYVIPASKLVAGESFQIFVEHAEMDSSTYRNIPEIATYASTSFIDIRTTGKNSKLNKKCPAVMPAMDGGQTDRPSK